MQCLCMKLVLHVQDSVISESAVNLLFSKSLLPVSSPLWLRVVRILPWIYEFISVMGGLECTKTLPKLALSTGDKYKINRMLKLFVNVMAIKAWHKIHHCLLQLLHPWSRLRITTNQYHRIISKLGVFIVFKFKFYKKCFDSSQIEKKLHLDSDSVQYIFQDKFHFM